MLSATSRETRERERSMVSPRPSSTPSIKADQSEEWRAPANQSLVLVAERELLAALARQAPQVLGMVTRPSPAELVAVERAVRLAQRDGDVLRDVVSSSIELFFESRDGEIRRAP
jgi:dihydroorotase-like cyclic amidohydrolase